MSILGLQLEAMRFVGVGRWPIYLRGHGELFEGLLRYCGLLK